MLSHEPRIHSKSSVHERHNPQLCPKANKRLEGTCGIMRCVDCCGQTDEKDVLECSRCGLQCVAPCKFDEDFS